MSTSRRARCRSLLGIGLAVLVACGPSPEDGRREPPVAPAATASAPESGADSGTADPAAAARLERVRRALEQGLDVNKADPEGRTALMMAAFEGHTDVVELLLEHGAEVDRRDAAGRTAVMYASSGPFPETVEFLARNGADVNRRDTLEGWTALMVAAAEGHQPVVEVLLRHGADIGTTDQDGDAAIDHARKRGQTHITALLESWPGKK